MVILNDRNSRNSTNIAMLENQYTRLPGGGSRISGDTLSRMRNLLEEEKQRYFAPDERDPYKLGIEILAMVEKRGIKVLQYKTMDQKEGFLLEFSVSAKAVSFFTFWQDLYSKGKYYTIPYFSIKNESDGLSATFRIGYAAYE